jgi:hypothetical protein
MRTVKAFTLFSRLMPVLFVEQLFLNTENIGLYESDLGEIRVNVFSVYDL